MSIKYENKIIFQVIGQPIGVGPAGPPSPPTTPLGEEHLYTVVVFTGSVKEAGTKSNVYLTVYGTKGSTHEMQLKKRGQTVFLRSQ